MWMSNPPASSLNHSLQVPVTPCVCDPGFGTSEESRMSSAKDLPLQSRPLALRICSSIAVPSAPASKGLSARAGEQKLLSLFILTFCLVFPLFSIIPRLFQVQ